MESSPHLLIEHQLTTLAEFIQGMDLKAMSRLQLMDLARLARHLANSAEDQLSVLERENSK